MDANSEYDPRIGTTEDPYAPDTHATIDWNIDDSEMSQIPTNADVRRVDISRERIPSLSVIQAGLRGEHLSHSVQSDEFAVSTVFPSDMLYNHQQPDAILCSSDRVYFYTHAFLLHSVSNNRFGGLIHKDVSTSPHNPIVLSVAAASDVLGISLRVIYLMEFPSPLPVLSTLENAVRFLKQHGIDPLSEWIGPSSHMFAALTSLLPDHALELYALGAECEVEPLAAHASSFLLGMPWSSIPEETADRIGGVYIKRLGNLQIGRMNALKSILLPGPFLHPIENNECSEQRQNNLTRSYVLAATHVCWDANADLPASQIEETFQEVSSRLTCLRCREALDQRVKDSIKAWTALKRTI